MPYRLRETEDFFVTPQRWSAHPVFNISEPGEDSERAKIAAKSFARKTQLKFTRVCLMTGSNDHEHLDRSVKFYDSNVLPLNCIVQEVVKNLEEICNTLTPLLYNRKSKLKIILPPPRNQIGFNVFLQKLHSALLENSTLKKFYKKDHFCSALYGPNFTPKTLDYLNSDNVHLSKDGYEKFLNWLGHFLMK